MILKPFSFKFCCIVSIFLGICAIFLYKKCVVLRKSACPFGQVQTEMYLPKSPFFKNSLAGASTYVEPCIVGNGPLSVAGDFCSWLANVACHTIVTWHQRLILFWLSQVRRNIKVIISPRTCSLSVLSSTFSCLAWDTLICVVWTNINFIDKTLELIINSQNICKMHLYVGRVFKSIYKCFGENALVSKISPKLVRRYLRATGIKPYATGE